VVRGGLDPPFLGIIFIILQQDEDAFVLGATWTVCGTRGGDGGVKLSFVWLAGCVYVWACCLEVVSTIEGGVSEKKS
jgi:hypothetical protein